MAARKTPSRGGKPDKLWTAALRIAVNEAAEDGNGKKLRAMADKVVQLALEGDMQAIKEIGDRLEGKPAQRTEIVGEGGGPVQTIDLSKLSDKELDALDRLVSRAATVSE